MKGEEEGVPRGRMCTGWKEENEMEEEEALNWVSVI